VEPVDSVVHFRDLTDELAIVGHQSRHGLSKHRLDDIPHVERSRAAVVNANPGSHRALIQIERT